MNALANPLVGSLLGGVLYLVVTALLLIRGYVPPPPPVAHADAIPGLPDAGAEDSGPPKPPPPSWSYHNPDVEYLVLELKRQKAELAAKEQELKLLERRLAAERAELSGVTQEVSRIQGEIQRDVVRMQEDESTNIRRLAKLYAGMEPASAAKVLSQMEIPVVVKTLALMKDDVVSGILEAISKSGSAGPRRAADITDKLRLFQSVTKK
jgi:hypothetical protein